MILILPWPPKELNPNSRCHWAQKSKAAKKYRADCHIITKAAMLENKLSCKDFEDKKFHLFVDFYPPDRRGRDDDNCYSSFKSGRDGIAEALGVNDKSFIGHPFLRTEPFKGGQVVVKIIAQGGR